jgi:hypothetical protein
MAIQMGKALAFTAVSGMVAGLAGCGGAEPAPATAPAASGDSKAAPAAGTAAPAAAGTAAPAAAPAKHACKGLNTCKGNGGCKTDKNACKGLNTCKGAGGCKVS